MSNPMTLNNADIASRTNVYADREMLKHAEPVIVLGPLAVNKSMPKNKTETIKFRRPVPFTAATVPLLEGVTPPPTPFDYEDVNVALKQYGDWSEFTDMVADLHEDPVGQDMSMQHGENIGRTIEALNWGVVRAGTNTVYANGSDITDVNTTLTLNVQAQVVRSLKAQKAKPITSILAPGPNFATRAVQAAYVAVGHTNLEDDIRALPGFTAVVDYGTRKPINQWEIGAVRDVRYVLSPDLDPFLGGGGTAGSGVEATGGDADVYPIVYMGQEAWGTVALRGAGAVRTHLENPGKPSKSDPLGQRGFVSWKTYHAALILNQLWMARALVACSAL